MIIQNIKLNNWRSYERFERSFPDKITVINGPNASGKTNIIEAIYFCLTGHGFRSTDKDNIKIGTDWSRIFLQTSSGDIVSTLDNRQEKLKKQRTFDDKKVAAGLMIYPVVLFEPNFITTFTGEPERRRSWLDSVLMATDPDYLRNLNIYQRALRQRNSLLKQPHVNKDHFFVWNIKLSEAGAIISEKRQEMINVLNNVISELYNQISQSKTDILIEYITKIPKNTDVSSYILHTLENNLDTDRLRGFTVFGPHRDDFFVIRDGESILSTGSRGEQRTLAIATKRFEVNYFKSIFGQEPILLLDDVASELDEVRAQALQGLSGHQIIITKAS